MIGNSFQNDEKTEFDSQNNDNGDLESVLCLKNPLPTVSAHEDAFLTPSVNRENEEEEAFEQEEDEEEVPEVSMQHRLEDIIKLETIFECT